ncbi:hypothetical protein LNKW23_14970 [Paralimibaculum aggregatum]|uniref:Uncharacterized protein n=1 Tax=Paralimibaculum aggregatum TaxID=3036245 RepID=A0ABQ6LJD3_9RHOB|nr:hypothetical protein [Limibaculum sp. NKW23]GMG82284.1 hypothetical protein LNKW23_14970 [Limibaculum sp. NKW23]
MRILLILGLGVLAAAIWSVVLDSAGPGRGLARLGLGELFGEGFAEGLGTGWHSGTGAGAPAGPGAASAAAARLLGYLPGARRLDAGEAAEGIAALEAGSRRAMIGLGDGQEITVAAPEGGRLAPGIFLMGDGAAGVIAEHADGSATVLALADEPKLRGIDLRRKLAVYEALASQVESRGSLGGGDGDGAARAQVLRHDGRGVVLCFADPESGREALGAMRIEKGLLAIAILREGCADPGPADHSRLDAALAGVRPKLWR